MPYAPILTALLLLPAQAGEPTLVAAHDRGVYVEVPEGWNTLVNLDGHSVTSTAGAATNLTLYWYPNKPGISPTKMIDLLVDILNKKLPAGKVSITEAMPIPGIPTFGSDIRGQQATADLDVMGYTMKFGLVTLIDEPRDRMLAAILLATPDTYPEAGGVTSLLQVVESFRMDADPPQPRPAWWWNADEAPAALAWSP